MAGPGSPGTLPLQPAVRGPLRGRRGLLHAARSGERLLRVEVGGAPHGRRGEAEVRGGTPGAGPAHRGNAVPGDPARHPQGLRDLRAGARTAGQEDPPLPAVPGGAGRFVPHPLGGEARRTGRRDLAHPGVGQVPDHAVAGDQDPPAPAAGQLHHRDGYRPDPARRPDRQHLPALRLSSARADRPVKAGAGASPAAAAGAEPGPARSPWTCRPPSNAAAAAPS